MNARKSRSLVGRSRPIARLIVGGAVGLLASAVPALGAVNPPHFVLSSPTDELVILEGYSSAAGPVTLNVMRGGLRVGSSGPHTVPAGGAIEINHPVDAGETPSCWNTFTPDVSAGDTLEIVQGATTETTQLRNLTVSAPVAVEPLVIEVHGTARDSAGTRLPLEEISAEMRADPDLGPTFGQLFGGGPAIIAPGGVEATRTGPGGSVTGILTYDDALGTSPAWTATFTFTLASSQNVAENADASAGWLVGTEATEVGVAPEPLEPGLVGCTEPSGAYAAVRTEPNVVSGTTPTLTVRGAAPAGATSVSVSLSDVDPLLTTPNQVSSGTLSQPTVDGGKIWEASFNTTHIQALLDGTLTATPTFEPGAVIGLTRTLQKTADGLATVSITAGPADGSTSTSSDAQFSFTSPVTEATFQCSLDGAPFLACTSPRTILNLPNGVHTFAVRAVDGATPGTPEERDWTIDRPEPVASIVTGPPAVTNQTTASFTVAATPPAALFQCSLDGAAFATCPAPLTYTGLSEGVHDLVVRGIDAPGNEGPNSPEHQWEIDLTPPNTTIDTGPLNGSNTADRTATFTFTSPGNPTATFECRLDGAAFAACTSPMTVNGLADGNHTFDVRAKDAAGNVDLSPATRTWEVNGPPETTITAGPDVSTTRRTATFAFTSDEAGAAFECSLDNAPFTACSSPTNVSGLALGSHTFRVRATDPVLTLTDLTPAIYSWTVDPPSTTLTQAPPASTTATTATFGFTSPNDSTATFECSLDGAPFAFCATPTTYSGLAIGSHTFRVRAVDATSTVDPTPATHAWDVVLPDTEAPTVTARLGAVAKLTVARNGTLNVKTTCDERCTVVVRARVVVTSPVAGGTTRVFKPVSSPIVVATGVTGTARIKLNAIMLRAVRNSLRGGKKVRITLVVSAKDAAGNEGIALAAATLTKKNL